MKPGREVRRTARGTLTPVELDIGDTLAFRLLNGREVRMTMLSASAAPLITNLGPGRNPIQGRTIYGFTATVLIDGHSLVLERYVGSQEGFAEPWVVNGMRVWLDAVDDIFSFLTENHGACRPSRGARFAVQDAGLGICPEPVHLWYPNPENRLDVAKCYGGDDPWMGAYAGVDAHGGLDLDMPEGTPLYSPVGVDDQWLAHSVARGDGNNRWEGARRWPDGSRWTLRVSHVSRLAVPEHEPVKGGTMIGLGAGMAVGYHEHSHFVFETHDDGMTVPLDPWLLFHEAFDLRRIKAGDLVPRMAAPGPARPGQGVRFRCLAPSASEACRSPASLAPSSRRAVAYSWTFGDGGFSADRDPVHAYARPGIYPVTLTVDDGRSRAATTNHLTVDGPRMTRPAACITVPEDVAFRSRRAGTTEVYHATPPVIPHAVRFTVMSDGAIELWRYLYGGDRGINPWIDAARRAVVRNLGGGKLPRIRSPRVSYEKGKGWLSARLTGRNTVVLSVNPRGLSGGLYRALITVRVPGALNPVQSFRAELDASALSPRWHAVMDDADSGCYATPYFWIGPRFPAWWGKHGHGGLALFSGCRARRGEFVRFTPHLWGGRYEVSLGPDTPFETGSRFIVRVRHRGGIRTVRIEPMRSRIIGRFDFSYGTAGWVEIHAGGSRGQVVADAVFFRRLGDSPRRTWDVGLPRGR